MPEKSPDEILFEKIRNYCKDPWVSTRVRLPEYGMPVLIAYHKERTGSDKANLEGFDGYAVSIGARFRYEETYVEYTDMTTGNKTTSKHIVCHFGTDLDPETVYNFERCFDTGLDNNYWHVYSYNDRYALDRGSAKFGIKDPYLHVESKKKKEKDTDLKSYDYWVDFSLGKYGKSFVNLHSADRAFIPQSTVDKMLDDQKKNGGKRYEVIQVSPDSELCKQPDFWMPIPALK